MPLLSRILPLLTTLSFLAAPGYAQDALSGAAVTLPFDLVGGLVVLRDLPLNGQRGDFVLDTGCAYGLVVEQASFADQLRASSTRGLGATGTVAQRQLAVNSFQFGSVHYAGVTAVATSLAQLRRGLPHLLGLVGYELLREYEVVIDYPHRRLSCYPLREAQLVAQPFVRQDSLAFTIEQGRPVTAGYVGSTPVRLLLDTGAMSNSLDAAFTQQLAPAVRPRVVSNDRLIGMSGQQTAQRAVLPELQLPPTAWRGLPFILAPLARGSSGRALPYQGILGYPFLSQDGLVSFHYGRRRFYSLAPKQPAGTSTH